MSSAAASRSGSAPSLMASGAATPEGNLRQWLPCPLTAAEWHDHWHGRGPPWWLSQKMPYARAACAAICEVLSTNIANSAYHGTRLNVKHVSQVMERCLRLQKGATESPAARSPPKPCSSRTKLIRRRAAAARRQRYMPCETRLARRLNQVIIANTKGFYRPYHGRGRGRCGGRESA